jgi:hypothetical protein
MNDLISLKKIVKRQYWEVSSVLSLVEEGLGHPWHFNTANLSFSIHPIKKGFVEKIE